MATLDFSHRSSTPELMDTEVTGFEEFRDCLVDLERVNFWTLTYRPMMAFLDRLVAAGLVPKDRPWKTAAELIDAIRAAPGKISTGVDFGSVGHITTMALLDALGLGPDAVRIVTFDGAGAMRTALAGGQVDVNIGQAEGAAFIGGFVRPLAVFLDHRVPDYDVPPINDVLSAYHTSVPLISGSVRTFVYPAAFKAKHPDDYARFVTAYRATLDDPAFIKWLHDNQMAGDWVGEERTTTIIRANYDGLEKYKNLIKP